MGQDLFWFVWANLYILVNYIKEFKNNSPEETLYVNVNTSRRHFIYLN